MFRKTAVMFGGLMLSILLTSSAFAGLLKGDIAKGPVLIADAVKGEVTVFDGRSGQEITYKVASDVAASLKKGQVVIIRSDEGSRTAKWVKPVQKK